MQQALLVLGVPTFLPAHGNQLVKTGMIFRNILLDALLVEPGSHLNMNSSRVENAKKNSVELRDQVLVYEIRILIQGCLGCSQMPLTTSHHVVLHFFSFIDTVMSLGTSNDGSLLLCL